MGTFEEKLLQGSCEVDDTVDLHHNPGVQVPIEEMHGTTWRLCFRQGQLQIVEDGHRELKVGICKPLLKLDSNSGLVILMYRSA